MAARDVINLDRLMASIMVWFEIRIEQSHKDGIVGKIL